MSTEPPPTEQPSALPAELDRWVAAGLIAPEQAARIRQFESVAAGSPGPPAAPPAGPFVLPPPEPTVVAGPPRAALAVEVVAYLGAALMASAVMGIVARQWKDVAFPGRVAMVAVPTVAAGIVGWMLRDRTGPLGRLASVLWFLGVGGVAGTTALVLTEGTEVADHPAVTITLAVVTTAALLAWWMRRASLQLLALIGTSTGLVAAGMQQAGVTRPPAFGLVVVGLGLCWFAQSRIPWFEPGPVGMAGGLVTAFVGSQVVASEWQVLGLALAALGALGVMALSVLDRSTPELLLGALGLFISLPRLMFTWLGNSVGAPVALLLCGGLLVAVAVRVARTRGGHGATDVTPSGFGTVGRTE